MHITFLALANACCGGLYPLTATRIARSVLGAAMDDPHYTLTENDGAAIYAAMADAFTSGPEAPTDDYCALFGTTVDKVLAERIDELRASSDATLRVLQVCGVAPVDA